MNNCFKNTMNLFKKKNKIQNWKTKMLSYSLFFKRVSRPVSLRKILGKLASRVWRMKYQRRLRKIKFWSSKIKLYPLKWKKQEKRTLPYEKKEMIFSARKNSLKTSTTDLSFLLLASCNSTKRIRRRDVFNLNNWWESMKRWRNFILGWKNSWATSSQGKAKAASIPFSSMETWLATLRRKKSLSKMRSRKSNKSPSWKQS